MAKVKAKVKKAGSNEEVQNYFVQLDGVKQAAVVAADSKGDAVEKFTTLFGIIGTERRIIAKAIEAEHEYEVDENGVVDPRTL